MQNDIGEENPMKGLMKISKSNFSNLCGAPEYTKIAKCMAW